MLMENTIVDRAHLVAADTAVKVHVALICDGNGRWATARGLSRSEGHRAGQKRHGALSGARRTWAFTH